MNALIGFLTISLILLVAGIILISEQGFNLLSIGITLLGFILSGLLSYSIYNYNIINEEIYHGKNPKVGELSPFLKINL